jgi:hypothetical protein
MAWKTYGLDQKAQKLVLDAKKRDSQSLNQSYKMRQAVAFGLERFWGEQLRLEKETGKYWQETWLALRDILQEAGIQLPNHSSPQVMAEMLWGCTPISLDSSKFFTLEDQRVALAVLTQLCDCLVWWTQRLKQTQS